jgi:hypothetical protein
LRGAALLHWDEELHPKEEVEEKGGEDQNNLMEVARICSRIWKLLILS